MEAIHRPYNLNSTAPAYSLNTRKVSQAATGSQVVVPIYVLKYLTVNT